MVPRRRLRGRHRGERAARHCSAWPSTPGTWRWWTSRCAAPTASSCSGGIHEIDPELIVIIMTGYASVETAVPALKNGAYDYVTKPLRPGRDRASVHNALAHRAWRGRECAPAGDGGRSGAAGRDGGAERGHEEGVRGHRDRRPHRRHRAHHRRKRHRQRTGGARHPRAEPAALQSAGGHPLRSA